MAKKVTLSVIKADVGSYPGHVVAPPELLEECEKKMEEAVKKNVLHDYYVTRCGDDIQLIMTHYKGVDSKEIHKLAWDSFKAAADVAKKKKMYGAGQDLLKDAFSGNVKGLGPGVAEMEFEERPAESVLVFCADKTDPGAFSLPMFRIYADVFCTPGLTIDPKMHPGFTFEVHDIVKSKKILLNTPEETYDLTALIGSTGHYLIKRIYRRLDNEIAACISTDKLSLIAGQYVGKDDPVAVARAQAGFPSVGELLEPFAFPHLVSGWMRGSHRGPLMPVGEMDAKNSRLDGPPRVIALGFNISDGNLLGPIDLFNDIAYDYTRMQAQKVAEYMRRHGPFEPHRLGEEDMEYTNLPKILDKFKSRFEKI